MNKYVVATLVIYGVITPVTFYVLWRISGGRARRRATRGAGVRRLEPADAMAAASVLLPLAVVAAVEILLLAPGHLLAAQIADAAIVLMLVNAGRDRGGARATAIRLTALIPLMRVVAPALPLRHWSAATAEVFVALPIGLCAMVLAVGAGRPPVIRPSRLYPGRQLLAAAAGIPLGLLVYLCGGSVLTHSGDGVPRVAVAIVAAVLAGAVEELVFRGVVQPALSEVAGRAAPLAVNVVFACAYLYTHSAQLVLTLALAGAIFAWAVTVSGSAAGAIAGHVLLVLGAAVVWPLALGDTPPDSLRGSAVVTAALAIAVARASLSLLQRAPLAANTRGAAAAT